MHIYFPSPLADFFLVKKNLEVQSKSIFWGILFSLQFSGRDYPGSLCPKQLQNH
jgi:hypothetical protein